jgi:hypothetical protein
MFSVPITVTDVTNKHIISYDFEVRFNPRVMRPILTSPTTKEGTMSSNFAVTVNPFLSGRVIVSGYSPYQLNGEGILLILNFESVASCGASSFLNFDHFMFNEGDPASTTFDGQVTFRKRVSNSF